MKETFIFNANSVPEIKQVIITGVITSATEALKPFNEIMLRDTNSSIADVILLLKSERINNNITSRVSHRYNNPVLK